MQNAHSGHGTEALDRAIAVALLLLGLALHLPWIARPFHPMDVNGGNYFGVFARNWDKHGFLALRGVPVAPTEVGDVATQGRPYFNHPPGSAWLSAALGSKEWQLRLPTALASVLAALVLFALLRPVLGRWGAATAGGVLLVSPAFLFFSVCSYETAVTAAGLALWLAFREVGRAAPGRSAGWTALLVVTAAVGPWLDWFFGYFVLGLLALALPAAPMALLRRLALPWLVAAASLAAVLAWGTWAAQGPLMPDGLTFRGAMQTATSAATWQVDLGRLVSGSSTRILEGFTVPLVVLGLLGVVPFARRAPWLFVAALLAGTLNLLVLREHTASHVLHWTSLGPLLAAGCGTVVAMIAGPAPLLRAAQALVAAALAWGAVTGVLHLPAATTTMFRDVGAAVTAATAADPDDARARHNAVLFHPPLSFGYYLRSELAIIDQVVDPATLESLRTGPDHGAGIRYLLLELEGSAVDAFPAFAADRGLVAYLERFGRQTIPALVGQTAGMPGYGLEARIAAAWLYTLRR